MNRVGTVLPDTGIGERFVCAEEAWFWTCGAMVARRDGHRRGHAAIRRNCDPDDVIICVERLLHTGRLAESHAQVLGKWGLLGWRPSMWGMDCGSAALWREAMEIIGAALTQKGILPKC